MEKLVYLLHKPTGTPVLDFRKRLLDREAPRLLEQGARSLTLNVADIGAETGTTVPISSPDPSLAATASLWLACLDDRGPLEATLREACERIDGYLVTESVPVDFDQRTWPDGERTPGAKLVTLFDRPERLSEQEFLREWHGTHTPLSLEIHPLWRYVRNVVARPVTEGAPKLVGIVDEQFRTLEDLTDPARFYGSAESMERNMKRVLDHCRKFLDLEHIQTYAMSEYIVRS